MSKTMQDYVMDICTAYEEGYATGEQHISSSINPHKIETEKYYSWYYGHTNALTTELLRGDSTEIVFSPEKGM